VAHHIQKRESTPRFSTKHGALSAGSDLYRARMSIHAAQTYCGANLGCSGFTWQSTPGVSSEQEVVDAAKEDPLIYFKAGLSVRQVGRDYISEMRSPRSRST
jgi:hypothetical protein